jgi:hypothetical protein
MLVELQLGKRLRFRHVARVPRTQVLNPPPWSLSHFASAAGAQARRMLHRNTIRTDIDGNIEGALRRAPAWQWSLEHRNRLPHPRACLRPSLHDPHARPGDGTAATDRRMRRCPIPTDVRAPPARLVLEPSRPSGGRVPVSRYTGVNRRGRPAKHVLVHGRDVCPTPETGSGRRPPNRQWGGAQA